MPRNIFKRPSSLSMFFSYYVSWPIATPLLFKSLLSILSRPLVHGLRIFLRHCHTDVSLMTSCLLERHKETSVLQIEKKLTDYSKTPRVQMGSQLIYWVYLPNHQWFAGLFHHWKVKPQSVLCIWNTVHSWHEEEGVGISGKHHVLTSWSPSGV